MRNYILISLFLFSAAPSSASNYYIVETAQSPGTGVDAAHTVCIGMIFGIPSGDTHSAPSFTLSRRWTAVDAAPTWTYCSTFSSAGSKTMSATNSDTTYWAACFAAFK